ncbi:MAG: Dyp-type peroxidase family [Conexibacter sp.]|nr:Dyp-type peroxidase family [Conexibacter sp.]
MSVDRRAFLLRSAATLGAGGLAGATAQQALAGSSPTTAPASSGATAALTARVPFDGAHQAGVASPPQDQMTLVALDAIAGDRSNLVQGLQALSSRARQLAQGTTMPEQEVDEPPADSGTLGTTIAPDGLTVTIAFGASLFDDRYGLARRQPARLTTMPAFPNDDLDPARSHGDLLLQIAAQRRDTVIHTLRELMRPVRDQFALRWTLDGFQSADRGPTPHSSRRNLFGFRDGTANPDVSDAALLDQLVWVQPGAEEPGWTAGGTYQVVRAIRMHVEFWDRVGLREQESMIGRSRDAGAPLGGSDELQAPDYEADPKGARIPLDAHIRLARPRSASTESQRILRRGWNYHRGFDAAGQLDQGLAFVAFNQDPRRQFATVQERLADEPMADYVTPVGGGYFFVPRGSRGAADWVGSGLFAA